jgi:hypothetical protein
MDIINSVRTVGTSDEIESSEVIYKNLSQKKEKEKLITRR